MQHRHTICITVNGFQQPNNQSSYFFTVQALYTWECFFHGEVILPEARAAEVLEALCPEPVVRSILQQTRQLLSEAEHGRGCGCGRSALGRRLGRLLCDGDRLRHQLDARQCRRRALVAGIRRQVDPEGRDEADEQGDYRYDEKHKADDAKHRHQLAHDDDDDDDDVRTMLPAARQRTNRKQ